MDEIDRRGFLVGSAGVIVGFDAFARSWVTTSDAHAGSHHRVPSLKGTLTTTGASRSAAAKDAGFIVHRVPWAVLRPASVSDVAKMIRFCARHEIKLAARGTGHSPFGQMQADGGLVIDMTSLARIHAVTSERMDVDAGVTWTEVLDRSLAMGATAPAFTGPIEFSVGGTVSVGGLSSAARAGAQVDNVDALRVVTGEGETLWCSPSINSEIFEAMLGGFGQLGVIVRVVLRLVPAPDRANHTILTYTDPAPFIHDLFMLLDRGEIENVFGLIVPPGVAVAGDPSLLSPLLGGPLHKLGDATAGLVGTLGRPSLPELPPGRIPAGAWFFQLHAGKVYRDGASPNMTDLVRGCSDLRALRQGLDQTYRQFVRRTDILLDLLKAAGMWEGVPHPWLDLFLPGEIVESFVPQTISSLSYDDVGAAGLILLLPQLRSKLTRPYLAVPDTNTPWVVLFDILTSAPALGRNPAFVTQKLKRNRRLYEQARELGATVYPISAVKLAPSDWAIHYGARYAPLRTLKRRHDPANIMTPGVRMFPGGG
jgi:FAD/FMN-containing dehydrogenase